MTSYDESYWYALRVTYSREMIVKQYCDANHIINFVPMTYKISEKNGVKVKKLEPVIHNLIFIKSNQLLINELKLKFPLRYIMDQGTGEPITIREEEMFHFMAVAGNYDEEIVYLSPDKLKFKVGARVRITGGPFKGVEGTLVRVRNNKRVVVQIRGFLMVATHYIHPSLLENIES
ncbi:UpxY family transcription antiterminator [Proteiniphilum acetatigenes]|uniref:UpxY family transcription antiterminator n=1 Tax=Proteiniphilum acetatigenes TaxID=294710 RepID=UPI00036996B4|nr:UpxY family transcription antiterminator [Proteiniphilum acetatigenes]SFL31755.1 Transcription antitermination factor NusG [Porphyromonadaceae bacterium KH3CP3RA]